MVSNWEKTSPSNYEGLFPSISGIAFWEKYNWPSVKEHIKNFIFTTVFGGRENRTLLFPREGKWNLFMLPLQKDGEFISSNDWLLGSYSWQKERINVHAWSMKSSCRDLFMHDTYSARGPTFHSCSKHATIATFPVIVMMDPPLGARCSKRGHAY